MLELKLIHATKRGHWFFEIPTCSDLQFTGKYTVQLFSYPLLLNILK